LALDAAGSHSVRVGSMRDHVQSVEVITAAGRCFEAAREPLSQLQEWIDPARDAAAAAKNSILRGLVRLLKDHADMISERQSADLFRNRAGYFLRGVLNGQSLNLPRMLIGSEGTLVLFTAATLHTSPLPAHRGALLLVFGSLEAASQAVQTVALQQPSACDLIDRRLLSLARETDSRFEAVIPATAEAALLVEQTGYNERQTRQRLAMLHAAVKELPQPGSIAYQAETPAQVDWLWTLPHRVVPVLNRLRGEDRPVPFVEDFAVPPPALHEFLVRAQRILQQHEVTGSIYAHAAAGQVHLRPFLPPPTPADASRLEAIAQDLCGAAISLGGTISGEHGLGLARSAFLEEQYGPLYRVFREIKQLFDPNGLLNPNKVITADRHLTGRFLRPMPAPPPAESVHLQLKWSPQELIDVAAACNGCGSCKSQAPGTRMCPFFRASAAEEFSPRAKANAIRQWSAGRRAWHELATPEFKSLADSCFNCKQCQWECPANIDIPHLMIEAKAQYVQAHGLSRAEWVLTRFPGWLTWLSRWAPLMNSLLNSPAVRSVMDRLLGIARERKLPPLSRHPFLTSGPQRWFDPARLEENGKPVIYFVDHVANAHDPEIALAFGRILEHHGIPMYVPRSQAPAGMAALTAGDLETARIHAEKNISLLAEFAREGCPIVCTEPSAAVCLKYDYPFLVEHPDVHLVANQVQEAGGYLRELHVQGKLKTDFQPISAAAAYHTPCHLKTLSRESPLAEICGWIPGVRLHRIEAGCSGMAGIFGLQRRNFANSLEMGRSLMDSLNDRPYNFGLTECSSCKWQMEQAGDTPTIHPLKLLAMAYDLLPEANDSLRLPRRRLLTT
jgi:Fe-S oxidoreductase/FAD/FMN-containing dehydrogenase